MNDLLIPGLACGLSWGLTPLVQWLGLRFGWVDQPDARKRHHQPVVRLGGVAIALALGLSLLTLLGPIVSSERWTDYGQLWGLLLGSLGFFLIGVVDDIYPLSPFHRLFGQAIIGTLVWALGIQLQSLVVPGLGTVTLGLLSLPITLIWLAGVANAINWMDGLDGLASSVFIVSELMVFSLVTLTGGPPEISAFCLAIVGATLGFLYHNAHPAKLFMGDGGSYLLGFALGATSLVTVPSASLASELTPLLPFALLGLPIVDMSRVIGQRLMKGRSPFYPDRSHLHHLLLDHGFSQGETVFLIISATLWMSSTALYLADIPGRELLLLGTTLMMVTQWASVVRRGMRVLRREVSQTAELARQVSLGPDLGGLGDLGQVNLGQVNLGQVNLGQVSRQGMAVLTIKATPQGEGI